MQVKKTKYEKSPLSDASFKQKQLSEFLAKGAKLVRIQYTSACIHMYVYSARTIISELVSEWCAKSG